MQEDLYRSLYRIRRVEEEIARVYPTDKIKSPVHLSIGQEAISVGVCAALRPDDVAFGSYRSHALYMAKGGDLRAMIAELYGKDTGCCHGKGGSMHLIAPAAGMMGTSAVVGTTIPQSAGYALAFKIRRRDSIVASFFGDGACEEGTFHETLNFASLRRLPILFVCENNFLAIHARLAARTPNDDIAGRARSYGIPAERIDEADVLTILDRARRMVAEIRAGGGPRFLECRAWRWKEHVGPNEDYAAGYRSREEAEPWIRNDAVRRMGEAIGPDARRRIEAEVETEIRDAFAFAESSPPPPESALFDNVTKES